MTLKKRAPLRATLVCLLFVGVFLFSGCAEPTSSGKVVASVNGQKITSEELDRRYALFSQNMDKHQFLNDIVVPDVLLAQEASRMEIDVSKREVADRVDALVEGKYPSKEAFLRNAEIRGLAEKHIEEMIGEKISIAKLVQQAVPPVPVDDGEALDFYTLNKEQFFRNGSEVPFAEVQGVIERMISETKREAAVRAYAVGLAEKGEVVLY